jgi:hypothetical protein
VTSGDSPLLDRKDIERVFRRLGERAAAPWCRRRYLRHRWCRNGVPHGTLTPSSSPHGVVAEEARAVAKEFVVTLTTNPVGNLSTVLHIPYRAGFRLVTENTSRYWGSISPQQDR